MTNKQKIIKMCLFSLCLTLCVISFAMIWYKDTDLWETCCLLLFIVFLGLSVVSLKYPKINYVKIKKIIDNKIKENPLSFDKINEMYRYYGLESSELNILRLYFNKDYTKRCIFFQQSNGVNVRFEEFGYNSDEVKTYHLSFADWYYDCDIKSGFYSDCEIAYKELKDNLKDFHEEKINFNAKHIISVNIVWKNWRVDSKELPFGERILLNAKNKNTEYKNVEVDINHWYSEFYCRADMLIDAGYEFNKNKKCKLNLYKNGEKVGVAYFK